MTEHVELPGWTHVFSGKVRDLYTSEDQRALLVVTSDRISAYDFILPTLIPDKGKILNQLSIWWMNQLSDIVDNHLVDDDSYPIPAQVAGRAVVCTPLTMVPIECVVRGYLTGSGLKSYEENGSVCGISLPQGLMEASRLPDPIFTPAAKADLGGHDENISFEETAHRIGQDQANELRTLSLALYERASKIGAERGVIIADTKFEFGTDPATGKFVIGDEVLTPDSSRFWPENKCQPGQVTPSFDKQYVRDWLTSPESGWDSHLNQCPPQLPQSVVMATRERYIEAFQLLTGRDPEI